MVLLVWYFWAASLRFSLVHSAGPPVCVRESGPASPQERTSIARGHGAHVCRFRRDRHYRRRVDRARQPIWPRRFVVGTGSLRLTLVWPALADRLSRPFVQVGDCLAPTDSGSASNTSAFRSLLRGVATGLLWAPCAGPILGLILTGATSTTALDWETEKEREKNKEFGERGADVSTKSTINLNRLFNQPSSKPSAAYCSNS
jgi:hypothetical protein